MKKLIKDVVSIMVVFATTVTFSACIVIREPSDYEAVSESLNETTEISQTEETTIVEEYHFQRDESNSETGQRGYSLRKDGYEEFSVAAPCSFFYDDYGFLVETGGFIPGDVAHRKYSQFPENCDLFVIFVACDNESANDYVLDENSFRCFSNNAECSIADIDFTEMLGYGTSCNLSSGRYGVVVIGFIIPNFEDSVRIEVEMYPNADTRDVAVIVFSDFHNNIEYGTEE